MWKQGPEPGTTGRHTSVTAKKGVVLSHRIP